uniref:Uncharacterized protein n=1 Tax=Oncorhynchus mykiss TaxID=8022 RepID=A0A8C7UBI0_ONCMY
LCSSPAFILSILTPLLKLDVKTKSSNGVEFKPLARPTLTLAKPNGVNTTLGTEITIEDQATKGPELMFNTQFSQNSGKKSGKVKTAYKCEYVNLGVDLEA